MFFEVRIFNADWELKRVVSQKKLSKNFWKKDSNGLHDYNETDLSKENWENNNAWDKVHIVGPDA